MPPGAEAGNAQPAAGRGFRSSSRTQRMVHADRLLASSLGDQRPTRNDHVRLAGSDSGTCLAEPGGVNECPAIRGFRALPTMACAGMVRLDRSGTRRVCGIQQPLGPTRPGLSAIVCSASERPSVTPRHGGRARPGPRGDAAHAQDHEERNAHWVCGYRPVRVHHENLEIALRHVAIVPWDNDNRSRAKTSRLRTIPASSEAPWRRQAASANPAISAIAQH